MKLFHLHVLFSLCICLQSFSFSKSETMLHHLTDCYFPLKVGKYRVYHSTPFDFTLEDSSTYQFDTSQAGSFIYTVMIIKNVSINTYAGRFENCVHLLFDVPEFIDDEISYDFAPNIGLVAEYGNVVGHNLYSARIDGQIISKISKSVKQPSFLSLEQNYPNPFNPPTTIEYTIPYNSNVTLKIYNIQGQEIETLVNQFKSDGNHSIEWKPLNITSGIYIYQLQCSKFVIAKKMLLLF